MFHFIIILFTVLSIVGAFQMLDVHGETVIMAKQNANRTLGCKEDIQSISALHPGWFNCSSINPSREHINVPITYMDDGQCSYKINITAVDTGLWQCEMTYNRSRNINTTNYHLIMLVMDDDALFAAPQQSVSTAHGKEVTLYCNTTDRAPLRYCFFQPPAGKPFSIDSDVTPEKPILERFYMPPTVSLDRGDCAVHVQKIANEDIGQWTCYAGREDGRGSLQTIVLGLQGSNTHLAAALKSNTPLAVARVSNTQSIVVLGSIAGVALFATMLKIFIKWLKAETEIEERPPRPRFIIPIIMIQPPTPTLSLNNNNENNDNEVNVNMENNENNHNHHGNGNHYSPISPYGSLI